MNVKIEESWRKRLQEEFDKPYFEKLVAFVKSEYGHANVLPPGHQRSEERRVGKECLRLCRSRWSPYH